jgi:hypothetical protein
MSPFSTATRTASLLLRKPSKVTTFTQQIRQSCCLSRISCICTIFPNSVSPFWWAIDKLKRMFQL